MPPQPPPPRSRRPGGGGSTRRAPGSTIPGSPPAPAVLHGRARRDGAPRHRRDHRARGRGVRRRATSSRDDALRTTVSTRGRRPARSSRSRTCSRRPRGCDGRPQGRHRRRARPARGRARPRSSRRSTTPPSPARPPRSCRPWSGTSRTSPTTRSCGCSARSPARRRRTSSSTTCTTRSGTRARERPTLADPRPGRSAAVRGRRAGTRARRARRHRPRRRRTRCSRDGFVYGMVVQHEHQHDETMLATLQLMDGLRPSRCGGAGTRAAVGRGRRRCARHVRRWDVHARERRRPWASTTSGPIARRRGRAVPDRSGARHERATYAAFVDGRRLRRRPRSGAAAGWAWRGEAGPGGAAVLDARGTAGRGHDGGSAAVEDVPPDEPVQHVCWYEADAFARWAGRAPADRDRVGGGRAGRPAGGRGATGRPRRAGRHTATRRAHGRAGCSAGCGSGRRPTSGVPGVPVVPVPRVLRGVLRARDYKVLRGGSWAMHPLGVRRHVPQLGPPDPPSDLLRLPLRDATPEPPMCRHLAYLGPPVALDDAALRRAPHSLLQPGARAAPPDSGTTTTPTAWGVGVVRETSHLGRALPHGPRRCGTTTRFASARARSRRRGARRRAVSVTPGHAHRRAATRPFVDGPWLFSLNGYVARVPRPVSATSSARGISNRRRRTAIERRHRLRGAVRARAATGSTRCRRPATRSSTVVDRTCGGRDRAPQPAARPTARPIARHRRGQLAVRAAATARDRRVRTARRRRGAGTTVPDSLGRRRRRHRVTDTPSGGPP